MTRRARKPDGGARLGAPDPPTGGDRRRIRTARRDARAGAKEIEAVRREALLETFRDELAVSVRSASPLLIAMLAIEGLTLDDAVAELKPAYGWPARPRLSGQKPVTSSHARLRHYYMAPRPSQFSYGPPAQLSEEPLVAQTFDRAGGGRLTLRVVDHSLELEARVGPAEIETRFGHLSVELDFDLPETIAAAAVGRRLEEIVDHESWRGRGWTIAAVVEEGFPWGQRLMVATGAVEYRMPWAC